MTRTLAILCLLAACGQDAPSKQAPAAEPSATATAAAGDDRPALVFLGDSLTAGLGLPADQSMPALIQQRIDDAGLDYRVINAGRSGDTSAGGLSRLSWYLRDQVDPAAFVIGLGSNDAMRGLPLSELEENLAAIVREIHAHDENIGVYLFSMKTFPNMGKQYTGTYEAVFERVAQAEEVTLLPFPLEGVAGNPALNQDDSIHPNAEGTRVMADNVWKARRPHL